MIELTLTCETQGQTFTCPIRITDPDQISTEVLGVLFGRALKSIAEARKAYMEARYHEAEEVVA